MMNSRGSFFCSNDNTSSVSSNVDTRIGCLYLYVNPILYNVSAKTEEEGGGDRSVVGFGAFKTIVNRLPRDLRIHR